MNFHETVAVDVVLKVFVDVDGSYSPASIECPEEYEDDRKITGMAIDGVVVASPALRRMLTPLVQAAVDREEVDI
jgi:hypothetical protein